MATFNEHGVCIDYGVPIKVEKSMNHILVRFGIAKRLSERNRGRIKPPRFLALTLKLYCKYYRKDTKMIEYRKGNIWDTIDSGEAQAIVIPVNTKGVMGAGLAKQAKERGYFNEYKFVCERQVMFGGKLHWSKFPHICKDGQVDWHYPIFAFTKEDWRNPSKIEWVEKILNTLNQTDLPLNCSVIALPALGCGLGGLKWEDVKPLCEKYLSDSETKFIIFEPQ